jgi:hypothetical protein
MISLLGLLDPAGGLFTVTAVKEDGKKLEPDLRVCKGRGKKPKSRWLGLRWRV